MSFDLYFLERPADGDWGAAMERLQDNAADGLTADELAAWDRIVLGLGDILPGAEVFASDDHRELSHDESGVQVAMFPAEISVMTPYWHEGDRAEAVVDRLRRIARLIEDETGLVAYDPQADAPFLAAGADTAARTFDDVADRMREIVGVDPPPPEEPRRRRWPFGRR